MHILYIHGLESSTNCLKVQWLKSLGHTVYNPKIDYKDPEAFFKVKRIAQKNNIDLIIGSSMGGYFAYAIATSTNQKCILLNPALHSRAFEPENVNYGMCQPDITCVLGNHDTVINPEDTKKILQGEQKVAFIEYDHGHRTPVGILEKVINKILINDKKAHV